jgi:Family of unknown function (DUF5683)
MSLGLVVGVGLGCPAPAQAQTDTTKINQADSLQAARIQRQLDSLAAFLNQKKVKAPTKAALYSAALPGLGQIHNRSVWWIKVPIIYGGATALVFIMSQNHRNYVILRDAYLYRLDNNPLTNPPPPYDDRRQFTDDGLRARRDQFRRDRDYMVVLTTAFYLLQIAEAATTAHLKTFDDSDDLSWRLAPTAIPAPWQGQASFAYGLKLEVRFK